MSINPVDIVIHIINIGVLYVILRLLVYKPVQNFMQKRREQIHADFADAEEKQKTADTLKEKYETCLADAEHDAEEKGLAEIKRARAEAEKILADAGVRADKLLADAREKAKVENEAKLSEMRYELKDISIDIAEKILAREVNAKDSARIVADFFKNEGADHE